MKPLKKPKYLLTTLAIAIFTFISCESENVNTENPGPISGLIELSSYEIDFGEIKAFPGKSFMDLKEEVLTLYNNTDSTLIGLGSYITFPGRAGVSLKFSPVASGDSISVPFTYSADGLAPGEYTGEAKLIPSIGDTLTVELKATVIE